MHEYKKGKRQFFLEFWDVGGNRKYKPSRDIFYSQINGILLVFDVVNKKSYENLRKWIREIVNIDKASSRCLFDRFTVSSTSLIS